MTDWIEDVIRCDTAFICFFVPEKKPAESNVKWAVTCQSLFYLCTVCYWWRNIRGQLGGFNILLKRTSARSQWMGIEPPTSGLGHNDKFIFIGPVEKKINKNPKMVAWKQNDFFRLGFLELIRVNLWWKFWPNFILVKDTDCRGGEHPPPKKKSS